mmetsp:Transcript_32233/g.60172  ORF Transcript_32233/g.60172 Transcript_32233/m.60172 type:complete len:837 (+) Transcript_32233:57-2567(+)
MVDVTPKKQMVPRTAAVTPRKPSGCALPETSLERCAAESDTFGFPVPPYAVQRRLMATVYDTLERGGIGIFESPTGTGKTLSLLCPALSWLRRRERQLLSQSHLLPGEEEVAEEWAREHRRATLQSLADQQWERRKKHQELRRQRMQRALALTTDGKVYREKVRRTAPPEPPSLGVDAEFSLEAPMVLPMPEIDFSSLTEADPRTAEEIFEGKTQIIFCSRTHSQLAQVLREIRRIPAENVPEGLSVVTLGARSNLCVNDTIRRRARGGMHLNDLCRLATDRSACAFKKQAQALTDACMSDMMDIEAMVQRGRAQIGGGCPYYGSRQAACEADVLLVPYSSLVHQDTRRKLGINPQGSVLIFDEAHNLLEAINDAHSVTLTTTQACAAVDDLDTYAAKYELRLAPGNAMRLRQLRQLCFRLHQYLAALEKSSAHSVGGFLVALGADHFDLADLSGFLEKTELPRKVRGYVESVYVGGASRSNGLNAVYGVAELLAALLGATTEDRILCHIPAAPGETASLRYLSLDPEARFCDLVASARSVIFAGGTLEPRAEFDPLYVAPNGLEQKPVNNFSGGHVVPQDHIFARFVTHGPEGHLLDFRKDARNNGNQLSELRSMLASAAAKTPGGTVFFFPSFEYLGSVAPQAGVRIGGREVFVEVRASSEGRGLNSESGDHVLRSFAAAVRRDGGALLLAVSGGKLSEGIDFKDDLCRLVAVVGLPYPNASDLSLVEKMKFLDARRARGAPGLNGREFYMARCMKGVNQCIGRSIRHIDDWSAVLLLDHRYAQTTINSAVSKWLCMRAKSTSFRDAEGDLQAFFSHRVLAGPKKMTPATGGGA